MVYGVLAVGVGRPILRGDDAFRLTATEKDVQTAAYEKWFREELHKLPPEAKAGFIHREFQELKTLHNLACKTYFPKEL